ncbi:MAG TPA: hypothetical protein VJZ26_14550 [Blastocatellia bacterium]|nr:hypothetical protein [Blastocatellia bacterium]
MPDGVLNQLPNVEGVLQISASAESGVGDLISGVSPAAPDKPGSPLGAIATALRGVDSHLSIDMSGLVTGFPSALETMRNALPADSLAFVHSISSAYDEARGFLQNSALVKEIKPGSSLQETALAVIGGLLRDFEKRQTELAGKLIDPAALQTITSALKSLDQFRGDFAAHSADFLPFLSEHLIGVAPDFLKRPLDHLAATGAVLAPFQPSAIDAALGAAQQAVTSSLRDLTDTVQSFDPKDAAGYARINDLLRALDAAMRALHDALDPVYRQAQTLVGAHDWDAIFSKLRDMLQSVSLSSSPSIDEVVNGAAAIVDGILARMQTFVGPQEIIPRIEALNQSLRDLFANSALGQVRRSLREFLEKIRHAIEAIPTEQIQQAIESMLGRVKEEIDKLGLDAIGDTIEKAFRDLETFITQQINQALGDQVRAAVRGLLDSFKALPIGTVATSVTNVLQEVKHLLDQLEAALQDGMKQLSEVAAQLDDLSFKPVSDAVIAEINELKTRLSAINPNALSDVEKLALKGALAVLQAIDLEGIINEQVKRGFNAAKDQLQKLLDELTAILKSLRERLDAYRPQQLVAALTGLLDQAQKAVDGLNARRMMQPLYQQVDDFADRLKAVSPGALLDPLQPPYQAVLAAVNHLNPDQIIAPLNALYAQINTLISHVDITPILEELDRRRKELFNTARKTLLDALDTLALPEPLASFFGGLRPVLEAATDALFQSADTELKQMSLDLRQRFHLASLFAPLDRAFDELLAVVATAPEQELVGAMESLRKTIGVGLDALNPRSLIETLRAGQHQLAQLSPRLLFALPAGLPAVKFAFQARVEAAPPDRQGDATRALASFDAAIELTSPASPQSLLAPLVAAHEELESALSRQINALDPAAAEAAYGHLHEALDQVLPDFLRRPVALTHTEILAGLESLRPSRKAEVLERIFDRFLQQVQPMQEALEPAMNNFFHQIHEVVDLINPLSLKDAVADIYAAIRQKVQILDPARLAATLHTTLYDPLLSALHAIDPAVLKARLDKVFQATLRAITDNIKAILDDIARALDEELQTLRAEVKKVTDDLKKIIDDAAEVFDGLVEQVENLVFTEILERLRRVVDSLGVSFDRELDRVQSAFDEMLAAIPLSGGASASASVSV